MFEIFVLAVLALGVITFLFVKKSVSSKTSKAVTSAEPGLGGGGIKPKRPKKEEDDKTSPVTLPSFPGSAIEDDNLHSAEPGLGGGGHKPTKPKGK